MLASLLLYAVLDRVPKPPLNAPHWLAISTALLMTVVAGGLPFFLFYVCFATSAPLAHESSVRRVSCSVMATCGSMLILSLLYFALF